MTSFAVVGAGFTGSIVARSLAEAGVDVQVFESRGHVAGNCHTERHSTGVMAHAYGPHVFHTPHEDVWNYITYFGEMKPFNLRTKATVKGSVYSLPINLHTINQFFGHSLSPAQAREFISARTVGDESNAVSFKDKALSMLGVELYEAFFEGYTKKQWQTDPKDLPASVFSRLPVRFNYDDSYFNHRWQAIPKNGYTAIVEKILDHKNITVRLNTGFSKQQSELFSHTVWTGPIDHYFDFELGRLAYRTLDFKEETYDGDFQGCPVMNYCDEDVPYTRITEHKHFTPWESFDQTVVYKEYSRACTEKDTPYYPIRLVKDKELLSRYTDLARQTKDVTFAGRLGTYRYLDMDVTIKEALMLGKELNTLISLGQKIPAFFAQV